MVHSNPVETGKCSASAAHNIKIFGTLLVIGKQPKLSAEKLFFKNSSKTCPCCLARKLVMMMKVMSLMTPVAKKKSYVDKRDKNVTGFLLDDYKSAFVHLLGRKLLVDF
jgi:hypothetical protein